MADASSDKPVQNGVVHGEVPAGDVESEAAAVEPAPSKPDARAPTRSEVKAAAPEAPAQSEPESVAEAVSETHAKEQEEQKPKVVAPAPSTTAQDAEKEKKRQNALTRTVWTLIMIGGFLCECSITI